MYDDLRMELMRVLTIEPSFTEEEYRAMDPQTMVQSIFDSANEAMQRKSERIVEVAMPVIKDWVENRGAQGKIIVPHTDGKRIFNLKFDIQEAYATGCRNIV